MMRSTAIAVLLAAASLAAQSGTTGVIDPPVSPRNANYTIDAHLDVAKKTITASEIIAWRNITSTPATELQFHLYWNAWKDSRSTWMREAAFRSPLRLKPQDASNIEVTSIKLKSGDLIDLTARQKFIAPDDGNPDDRTVISVPLPRPVPPGETVTLEVAWTATVPGPIARTSTIDDFFFIAQWFPKLGVFQDGGWNCHQFHASTEFFSDYGTYDVRLTVPRSWTVGATGTQQERRDNGDGTTTHRYYQDDVHDFAWTTSPDYIERTASFNEPNLPPVTMRLLLQPEHASQAERHFASTRTALKWFGTWFGPYPYGHITIVDPAYRSQADGMEYPTLITAGTRWLIGPEVTPETPEEVVVHEAGHQFWYGIVGTNEFEHAWMDEGINTYATARAMEQDFPETHLENRYFGGIVPWVFSDVLLRRETFWNRLPGYRPAAKSDVESTPAYRFDPASGRYITYNKTALWLNTLERRLGWPTLQRVMSRFFLQYQFKHPTPDDFFKTANEVSGTDLTPFFDQVYRTSNAFDYGVADVKSEKEDAQYRSTVIVRRFGEALFPVDVLITFENGETVTERWDGVDRWRMYTYTRPVSLLSAQVDPKRVLLLDVNYTNNSMTLKPKGPAAATKWSLKWMIWLQDAMLSWASLA